MMTTVADLVAEAQVPSAATRGQIRAKFERLQTAFGLIGEGLNAIGDMLAEMQTLLDEPAVDEPAVDEPAVDEPACDPTEAAP